MGLFDSVLGGLLGGSGGNTSPMGGILSSLLGGGQSGTSGQQQAPGMNGGIGGGLGGLVSSFEQAGLGHLAQSWVGAMAQTSLSRRSSCKTCLATSKYRGWRARPEWHRATSYRNSVSTCRQRSTA